MSSSVVRDTNGNNVEVSVSFTEMEYCWIMPFLSSNTGGSHVRDREVELTAVAATLRGAAVGAVYIMDCTI